MSEPKWLSIARGEMNTKEIAGPKHNPRIVEYAKIAAGVTVPDEDAWCATFVGWNLAQAGIKGTGARNARSYLDWGREIEKPVLGCIVVFWRGSKTGWQGHVAFFIKEDATHVWVLGGNQSNQVSIAKYPKSQLLGYRWPEDVSEPKPAPSASAIVRQAQTRLRELGYFEVGKADGIMGSRTRGALLAFKADWNDANAGTKNDLPLDDKLDEPTLAALMSGLPRVISPDRETAPESAVADHAAVKDANKVGVVAKVGAAVAVGGGAIDTGILDKADELVGLGGRVKGLLTSVGDLVGQFWWLALLVAAVAIFFWVRGIKKEEVEAYRSGEMP